MLGINRPTRCAKISFSSATFAVLPTVPSIVTKMSSIFNRYVVNKLLSVISILGIESSSFLELNSVELGEDVPEFCPFDKLPKIFLMLSVIGKFNNIPVISP